MFNNSNSLASLLALAVIGSLLSVNQALGQPIAELDYEILAQQSHPQDLFTQGFLADGPWIYESSGGYGRSALVRYKASDSSLLTRMPLAKNLFAEGLTLLQDHFYLLTWRAGKMLVLDRNWNQIREHSYTGEGWGLTSDDQHLIMSNGTDQITFFNPAPFKELHTITVHGGNRRWLAINELEYVNGVLWANRWFSDEVLAISPNSGQVLAKFDFSELADRHRVGHNAREKVLNGLAWSETHQAMWVTGKNWDSRYLVKLPTNLDEISQLVAER